MREKLPDKRKDYIRSCILLRQSRLTSNEVNAYFDRSKHVDRLEAGLTHYLISSLCHGASKSSARNSSLHPAIFLFLLGILIE